MQVEVDTKCMKPNLAGVASPVSEFFRLPFCFPLSFPFWSMGYNMELAQKIHASKVEVTSTHSFHLVL